MEINEALKKEVLDHEKAEKKILESEKRQREIIENSNAGYFFIDFDDLIDLVVFFKTFFAAFLISFLVFKSAIGFAVCLASSSALF